MTLTKKHFEAIAEILHTAIIDRNFNPEMERAIKLVSQELGDYFKQENSSFDQDLFNAAVFEGKIGLKDAKRKKVNE